VTIVFEFNNKRMISKNKIKFITSLQKKNVREQEKLFVIEGDKLVKEFLIANVAIKMLVAKPEFLNSLPPELTNIVNDIENVNDNELKQISTLRTPHNALAVVQMPEHEMNISEIINQFCVALDFVQDPGNFGTIIRAAGWFGISGSGKFWNNNKSCRLVWN